MKRRLLVVIMAVFTIGIIACSDKSQKISPELKTEEEVVHERPDWVMEEPECDDENCYFVGLSNIYASEKGARDDSMANAYRRVVQYLGVLAKSKIEEASVSYGLNSQTIDPTLSQRVYEKQIAANVAKEVKATKLYMERETGSTGKRGYKYFTLARMPKESINAAFQQTAKKNMEDAQKRAREAATEQAKQQAENATNFWKDMQKQGLLE
ncbi:MAG: hypothetical protein HQM14_19185 [SAR324 cluster bacterium]|nr:hypothetical protein [SAR324 cluster bacterium]